MGGRGSARRGGLRPAADAARHHPAHTHGSRCGVRLPLRAVQHRRAGPVLGRLYLGALDRHAPRGHTAARTSSSGSSRPSPAGAIWGGIAGILRATVGAHEVITTIMLNWIAIYGGKYLFEQEALYRGHSRRSRARPRSTSLPSSGRSGAASRLCTPASSSRSPRSSSTTPCSTGRRSATRCARSASTRTPLPTRGISVRRKSISSRWRSGAFAGLAGGVDLLGWRHDIDISDFDTSLLGFTGIAVALLGRNKAVGILLAALLFGKASRSARRPASSIRLSSSPSWRRTCRP